MTPYRTAAGYGEAEYEDKRSRFIGHIKPVTSENEAKAFIDEMRRTYADATHNVFAYVLREGNILRWSDDGEPGGTAGMPVLQVLPPVRCAPTPPRPAPRCARRAPPSCAHGGAGALPAPTPGTNGCAAFWKSAARALRKRSSARRSRSFFPRPRRRAKASRRSCATRPPEKPRCVSARAFSARSGRKNNLKIFSPKSRENRGQCRI